MAGCSRMPPDTGRAEDATVTTTPYQFDGSAIATPKLIKQFAEKFPAEIREVLKHADVVNVFETEDFPQVKALSFLSRLKLFRATRSSSLPISKKQMQSKS